MKLSINILKEPEAFVKEFAKNKGKKLSNFVSNVSFLPYLIPAMSFSTIYLAVSSTDMFNFLYRSIPLLIIVGAVKFLPFATRSGTNAMLQLSNEIEEAAIIVRVPWWKRMVRVLFPIQKSSFISGYLLPFISMTNYIIVSTILLTIISTILLYKFISNHIFSFQILYN